MRVAIYSRYSSDLQQARSIVDQIAAAREYAFRYGWLVVAEYQDAAMSGATLHRPGLKAMMEAAAKQEFDGVLTESLDRLSRDQADIHYIFKELEFRDVKVATLADHIVTKMHVGIKGMFSSFFLDDLAQKTRRGQTGRVKAGRIPGGKCYGYDVVPSIDEKGQRKINSREAEIVRRIFSEYIQGYSPLEIVSRLNREGVPAPRGSAWSTSTINGNASRGNGILNNQMYVGKIVFNRQRFLKDPVTGKRQARENPRSDWVEQEVPELRVVSNEVFEAAQVLRLSNSRKHLSRRKRPKHLFSGLVFCGCCGASMIVIRGDWLGCSASRNRATCANRRTIRVSQIQTRVLSAIQAYLLAPDIVQTAADAYQAERDRLAKEQLRNSRELDCDLASIDKKINALIALMEKGGDPETLATRLNALAAERRELQRRIPKLQSNIVALRSDATEIYIDTVRQLSFATGSPEDANRQAQQLVRELVERIDATPDADPKKRMRLELAGNLGVLLEEPAQTPTAMAVVAGAGFEPTTFGL